MLDWYKKQTRQVRVMLVVIVLLVLGILVRWEYVSREAGEAFGSIFREREATAGDSE